MEKVTRFFVKKLNLDGNGNSYSPILCSDSAILPQKGPKRSNRVDPPTHYTFMIGSYGLISKFDKQISPIFEQEGFKWNLCFYPNGKKNEGGEGFISIYLMITDTNSLPHGWTVKAFFRLLLLNQINGKYTTLGDTYERCFHATNKEQGFARFISLKTFLNPKKGYLIDDACVIGAEVFAIRNTGKLDYFERIRGRNTYTHCWKIQEFSNKELTYYYSTAFTVGGHEWKIKLYPKGAVEGSNNLSLFIKLADSSKLCPGQQLYVDYILCIKGHAGNSKRCNGQCWFNVSAKIWGCQKFISLDKLHDPEKGYLVEDSCTIEAVISVLGVANTMP